MRKLNVRLFIYVISVYFLFVNFGLSETYVCSYKWGDEIRMNPKEKRTGSTFTTIYEDGTKFKYPEVIEYEDRIILIDSVKSVFMKVIWKNEKKFSMIGLNSDNSKNTSIIHGKCTVTK